MDQGKGTDPAASPAAEAGSGHNANSGDTAGNSPGGDKSRHRVPLETLQRERMKRRSLEDENRQMKERLERLERNQPQRAQEDTGFNEDEPIQSLRRGYESMQEKMERIDRENEERKRRESVREEAALLEKEMQTAFRDAGIPSAWHDTARDLYFLEAARAQDRNEDLDPSDFAPAMRDRISTLVQESDPNSRLQGLPDDDRREPMSVRDAKAMVEDKYLKMHPADRMKAMSKDNRSRIMDKLRARGARLP